VISSSLHKIFIAAVRLREFCEIACVNCKRPSFPSSRLLKSRSNSLPSLFKDLKVEASPDISKSAGTILNGDIRKIHFYSALAGNSPVTFVSKSDGVLAVDDETAEKIASVGGSPTLSTDSPSKPSIFSSLYCISLVPSLSTSLIVHLLF
jgi:hypothetical protein